MKSIISIIFIFAISSSAFAYETGESGRLQDVQTATVLARRVVASQEATRTEQGIGSGLGAVLGGLAAAKIGQGNGRIAAGAIGAVVGGLLGNKATSVLTASTNSVEYILRLENGRTKALVQKEGEGMEVAVGEQVYLLDGQITRAIRADVASTQRSGGYRQSSF